MIPEFLKNRKTYILSAIVFTIIGVLSLSFAFFRAQTTNQPTNSTVMVETVDIAGSTQKFTVYYDNNDGFFETGLLNISSTYTDIMKFRVVSGYSLGSQNISINWKSVTSTLTKANTSYNLYSCTSSNYSSATLANVASLCTRISPISGNYLPASNEKTRLTSASDINLAANATNYYIATISIPTSETGKSFDGSIAVKHNADHILTINPNGGTLGSTTSMILGTGDSISITNITKTGEMVSNWTTVCTECQINGMQFTMGTSDATITAQWVPNIYNYGYNGTTGMDGSYQLFTAPQAGTYKIELWGASGGGNGGYGGYTSGEIYLEDSEKLYVYVGGAGKPACTSITGGGWNGGGNGGPENASSCGQGGGGATDIRYFFLEPTSDDLIWNSLKGLNSRIMVAAGGGGIYNGVSPAGGLQGYDGSDKGGTQTFGYAFGYGGAGCYGCSNGGGGGGYYGGHAASRIDSNGSGGSSYISGHSGSNSITNISNQTHTGKSVHFTNKYFLNTKMIDGNGYSWSDIKNTLELMPNPAGGNFNNIGNNTNGYGRISFINYEYKSSVQLNNEIHNLLIKKYYSYKGTTGMDGSYQLFTAPQAGTYKIELWGASGGGNGGYGGYTSGEIYLEDSEKLYVYVGGAGKPACTSITGGGWNGGGNGGPENASSCGQGGGGATDIRYFSLEPTSDDLIWNSLKGLNSRIMVAAGGGGIYNGVSPAGGLQGYDGSDKGGTQTFGYAFGYGGTGCNGCSNGGGGGGYYGGHAASRIDSNGSGGSSYISGHSGSNSITNISNQTHTGKSVHFTNKYFLNTKMIDGNGYSWSDIKNTLELMPNPAGGLYASSRGHIGDGYAKITYLNNDIHKTAEQISLEVKELSKKKYYSYANNVQIFTASETGEYIIEAWGASGGGGGYGNGAYTRGTIYLEDSEKLYVYVGGAGKPACTSITGGGWNGGGNGGPENASSCGQGGGGATDIRYFSNVPTIDDLVWNSSKGLNSRIMVAAGGGGKYYTTTGAGGGLSGYSGGGAGGTQTTGNIFGIGGTGCNGCSNGGGGGGYFGGYGSASMDNNGGGGSSFISGHAGSLAVGNTSLPISSPNSNLLSGCSTSTLTLACSYHPSLTARTVPSGKSKYFTETKMIDGIGYEWTTTKTSIITQIQMPEGGTYAAGAGRLGDGFLRITFVG